MNTSEVAHTRPPAANLPRGGSARDAASLTLMLIRLGTRWFGLDVRAIEEVAVKAEVTRVPTAPKHILGVTSLRGRLVTVVVLEQMINGIGTTSHEGSMTLPRLVVVREGDYEMALVADAIQGMVEHVPAAEPDKPDEPDEDTSSESSSFVREEFDWRGNRVSHLDVPSLIATAAHLAGVLAPSEEVEA